MRLLLITVCFILTACASTSKSDNYIRSTGIGNTYEEAKNNAFKEAIEYQVGVVIASERVSYNDKLIKNEILAYSSAFVDEYKIISQQNVGNKVQLVIDVKLSLLRLSDRILSKGKDSKNIDGEKLHNQYKSFLENKQNGDRILGGILNDYPKRAHDIKQGSYIIKVDSNRNLTLTIPYTLSWNPNYIASFHDAIKMVADGKPSFWTLEKGFAQQYPGSVNIAKESYYFNDDVIPLKIVYGMLAGNEPMVNMELKDKYNQKQYSKCFTPKTDYHPFNNSYGSLNIIIYQNANESSEVSINIQQDSKLANIMKDLFTIELSIVPKKVCLRNI
jgi:hypothetical protein